MLHFHVIRKLPCIINLNLQQKTAESQKNFFSAFISFAFFGCLCGPVCLWTPESGAWLEGTAKNQAMTIYAEPPIVGVTLDQNPCPNSPARVSCCSLQQRSLKESDGFSAQTNPQTKALWIEGFVGGINGHSSVSRPMNSMATPFSLKTLFHRPWKPIRETQAVPKN